MSTPEEIRERRRQKVLEKLNAKYKDTPLSDEDNDKALKTESKGTPAVENKLEQKKSEPSAPALNQGQGEPQISVFDEYKKMRNVEKFEESMFKIRTFVLILYSLVSAFTIIGNPLLGIQVKPIQGFISLEILFFTMSYAWKKTKGSSYFDNKGLDLSFLKNLLGDTAMNLVNIAGSYFKVLMFVLEKVEELSMYVILTILFCEGFNFAASPKAAVSIGN